MDVFGSRRPDFGIGLAEGMPMAWTWIEFTAISANGAIMLLLASKSK
jgi:hypothetical protein